MICERLKFKLAWIGCAVMMVLLPIRMTSASIVVDVTIGDHFVTTPTPGGPLGASFPASLDLGTDGILGGVAFVPASMGGLQAAGTPSFVTSFSTMMNSPLPSAWPTPDPILFAGAFEFAVDAISGDPASILAGVPQKVTVESDLFFAILGAVPFSFSSEAVSLSGFLSDADGWVPGSGSLGGIPFTGWAAGFVVDDLTGRGIFSIITTDDGGFGGDNILSTEILGGKATVNAHPIPEPGSVFVLGCGMLGLIGYGWWRRRKRTA
jgi:hypothetical protein